MDASNIIALVLGGIGFISSIIGIIVMPMINLKSKRLEERLKCRFILFQKILELQQFTTTSTINNQKEFHRLMAEVSRFSQLYGYESELTLFQEVVESYHKFAEETNNPAGINREERLTEARRKLESAFNNFFSFCVDVYRKELVLN